MMYIYIYKLFVYVYIYIIIYTFIALLNLLDYCDINLNGVVLYNHVHYCVHIFFANKDKNQRYFLCNFTL